MQPDPNINNKYRCSVELDPNINNEYYYDVQPDPNINDIKSSNNNQAEKFIILGKRKQIREIYQGKMHTNK